MCLFFPIESLKLLDLDIAFFIKNFSLDII